MNYETLLVKYIHHVEECEGTNFLLDWGRSSFTPEELAELNRLAEQDREE
jgi:hypothetical protein